MRPILPVFQRPQAVIRHCNLKLGDGLNRGHVSETSSGHLISQLALILPVLQVERNSASADTQNGQTPGRTGV